MPADDAEGTDEEGLDAAPATGATRGSRAGGFLHQSRSRFEWARQRGRTALSGARQQLWDMDAERLREAARQARRRVQKELTDMTLMGALTRFPKLTVGLTLIFTVFFVYNAGVLDPWTGEQSLNVNGDMVTYLPTNSDVRNDIAVVEEDWTTNIMIIYVETDGANVTDKAILDEMSEVENLLNVAPSDHGESDDIIYILSLSTTVKEINSSSARVTVAIMKELCGTVGDFCPEGLKETIADQVNDLGWLLGSYSVPDQQRIDQIVGELPVNAVDRLVQDIEPAGDPDQVWDRAVIVIGVKDDAVTSEILARADAAITQASADGEWEQAGLTMTLTGPVPITNAITEFSFTLFWEIFPIGCAFVAIALFLFHSDLIQTQRLGLRGMKQGIQVVIIAGLPTLCSVFWTLGMIGWLDIEVTSTVIIVGPILLALGVSYGLHITNRYAAESGTPEEKMAVALQSTGKAVLLSAITTIIGFISLVITPMAPIRTVGLALSGGIAIVLILTMLMVPNLTMILDLKKPNLPPPKPFEMAVKVPVKWSRSIIAVFLVLVLLSVTVGTKNVDKDIDLLGLAPSTVPSVLKMQQYSEEFGAGQTGMLLVNGAVRGGPVIGDDDAFNDDPYANLQAIADLEDRTNLVDNTSAISIVYMMKSVGVTLNVSGTPVCQIARGTPLVPDNIADVTCLITDRNAIQEASFWAALEAAQDERLQIMMLNIFYDSLTDEMRRLFISHDYQRSLVYIDMPYMPIKQTEAAADKINEHANSRGDSGGIQTSNLIGVAAVALAVNDLIVGSQWWSLGMAIGLTLLFLGFVFHDFRFAFLTTLPVAATVAMQWLVMWNLGVDLSLVTVMIGSIMVGVGVDFSIHIANRVRELGGDLDAVRISGTSTGMSLFEATGVTTAGLVTAYFIPIPAISPFVTVIIILLVIAAASALLLLPAIYALMVKSGVGISGGTGELARRAGLPSRSATRRGAARALGGRGSDEDLLDALVVAAPVKERELDAW